VLPVCYLRPRLRQNEIKDDSLQLTNTAHPTSAAITVVVHGICFLPQGLKPQDFFAHRALTAFRAASDRSSGVRFLAVAFPPFRPSSFRYFDRSLFLVIFGLDIRTRCV